MVNKFLLRSSQAVTHSQFTHWQIEYNTFCHRSSFIMAAQCTSVMPEYRRRKQVGKYCETTETGLNSGQEERGRELDKPCSKTCAHTIASTHSHARAACSQVYLFNEVNGRQLKAEKSQLDFYLKTLAFAYTLSIECGCRCCC